MRRRLWLAGRKERVPALDGVQGRVQGSVDQLAGYERGNEAITVEQ